jgi:hypothetical protein
LRLVGVLDEVVINLAVLSARASEPRLVVNLRGEMDRSSLFAFGRVANRRWSAAHLCYG